MKKLLWIALSIGLSTQLLSATSVTPLSSGKAIDGTVQQKEKKYYNITVPQNKSVRVNLTGLEADVDLYVKKGNEVRVRFNDCYSSNSNTENEECVVTNEGETSTYSILVNGFKASSFNLKATVDGAEEIPTLSSDPIADAVEKKDGKQYKVDGKKGETITVTLSDLTADADLRVRVGRKAGLHSFNCKSNNSGTKTEECVITPKKDATVYVHVYGYQAANYSLKAVKGSTTTNPCITREELDRKIKNNDDVTKVNTSCITDMSWLFTKKPYFNQDISKWNVSNVTNMSGMFDNTTFNQDISKWNVSKVTDMSLMFVGTMEFNQDISKWDVSNVTNMEGMFSYANAFNQDLSSWDTSNVKSMEIMFENASAFKGHDLSSWNVAKVFAKDGFCYPKEGNIPPKWNIDKTILNIAKANCLTNTKTKEQVICLPKNIAFMIKIEDTLKNTSKRWTYLYRVDMNTNSIRRILDNAIDYNKETFKLIDLKGFPFMALTSRRSNSTPYSLTFRNANAESQEDLYFGYTSIKEIKTLENGKKLSIKYEDKNSVVYENIYEMTTPLTMKLISKKKVQ